MQRGIDELLANRDPIVDDGKGVIGDSDYTALTKDLQCNILTAHARNRAHYWFLQFPSGDTGQLVTRYLLGMLARNAFERVMVRQAIVDPMARAAMTPRMREIAEVWDEQAPCQITPDQHELVRNIRVMSEYEVYWQRGVQRDPSGGLRASLDEAGGSITPESGEFPVNVLLTPSGYRKLGFEPPAGDVAFNSGMRQRGERLKDPAYTQWEAKPVHAWTEIDALVIVAYDPDPGNADLQNQRMAALRDIITRHAKLLFEEVGNTIPIQDRQGKSYLVEPFGFREGISQPVFYAATLRRILERGRIESKWNPFAPLNLVLRSDPHGRSVYPCGTYFVFRKLQQDVASFYRQTDAVADKKNGQSGEEVRERFIGRKRDGRPLVNGRVARSTGGTALAALDGFDFSEDPEGLQCPYASHVRKSNPRADVRDSYGPRERRIVRRGMPYGEAIQRLADGTPEHPQQCTPARHPVGLLFLCAQGCIEEQFEHIQSQWSNQEDHPRGRPSGVDLITGQVDRREDASVDAGPRKPIRTPAERDLRERELRRSKRAQLRNVDYDPVVTLRGGEYFFAPSLSFMRYLLSDLLQQ